MPNRIQWQPIFKSGFDAIFLLGTLVLTILSLAGYFGLFNIYLEVTSHFKLQYLVASFCPFFYFILRRQQLGLSISLFCLLINLFEIAPWYLPQSFRMTHEIQGQNFMERQFTVSSL